MIGAAKHALDEEDVEQRKRPGGAEIHLAGIALGIHRRAEHVPGPEQEVEDRVLVRSPRRGEQHLGIDVQAWGGTAFTWTDAAGNPTNGTTVWSIGAADSGHFAPSKSTFMVNYRVEDLAALLQSLRDEGCNVLEKTDDSEYGKFGWVIDPEGNKVELWQPPEGQ